MAERTCHNCVYVLCDPGDWLRRRWAGEPLLPRCANHPRWPGQLRDVPGVPCRNYRARPVPPRENVMLIALGDGAYTYVDAADYEWLNQYKWYLDSGYAARRHNRKTIYMHREIVQPPEGKIVDHIDGNRANNCRSNLRACTRAENMRNRRSHSGSSSVYKGVCYDKPTGTWKASCYYRGKYRVLRYFRTEAEAARAYDRAAVKWFGEFARLNFPEEWPPERRRAVRAQQQEATTKKNRKDEGQSGR